MNNNGISFIGILGIIFVVCKIFAIGPIALWSWWLVLLPFYFGIALVLGILLFGGILAGILAMIEK